MILLLLLVCMSSLPACLLAESPHYELREYKLREQDVTCQAQEELYEVAFMERGHSCMV